MLYALIDSTQFEGLKLVPEQGREIARISALVMQAAKEQIKVEHPDYPGIEISISEMYGPAVTEGCDIQSVNTVFIGDIDFDRPESWNGALDRCACGTGTCALMAMLCAKGKLELNKPFRRECLIGIIFTGHTLEKVEFHGHKAIIPTIGGEAWIYGFSRYVLEETDPFPNGYTVGDIW